MQECNKDDHLFERKGDSVVEKQWTISSQFGQEKNIVQAINDTITSNGFSRHRLDDMLTSVAEACLNALEHGNLLDEKLQVKVTMKVTAQKYIFRIYDHGTGYKDIGLLCENTIDSKLLGEESPRGWGMFLIEALSDELIRGCDETGLFYTEIHFERDNETKGREQHEQ